MPIRRGEPWGEPVPAPQGLRLSHDDADASESIGVALAAGEQVPPIGLLGGDLARTMGAGGAGRFTDGRDVVRAPVDLWRVETDVWTGWSLAHVVLRRRWWSGRIVLAMNAQYIGVHDVAPRSHPHDGRIDVLEVDPAMGVRARMQARARSRTGTHLPHPCLRAGQHRSWSTTLDEPLGMWVDGVHRGSVREVRLTLHPDAVIVHA